MFSFCWKCCCNALGGISVFYPPLTDVNEVDRSFRTFSHRCRIHDGTSAQGQTTVTRPWPPPLWAGSGWSTPLCSMSRWCGNQQTGTWAGRGGRRWHGRCLSPHCGLEVVVQRENSHFPVIETFTLRQGWWHVGFSIQGICFGI